MAEQLVLRTGETGTGSWQNTGATPDRALRGRVQSYQGYSMTEPGFIRDRHPATTVIPIILTLGTPLGVHYGGAEGRPYRAFVSGLVATYAETSFSRLSAGLQVNVSPTTAYALFGVSMHELANGAVEFEDLLGSEGRQLLERLEDLPGWQERFDLLDAFFERRLAAGREPPAAVQHTWQRLVRTHGCVTVAELANEVGCSRKHLAEQFREYVGLPPKTIGRILRFQRAAQLMQGEGARNWADAAFAAGYYDQSHLTRDFVQFAGTTPGEYLRRQLPDGGGMR